MSPECLGFPAMNVTDTTSPCNMIQILVFSSGWKQCDLSAEPWGAHFLPVCIPDTPAVWRRQSFCSQASHQILLRTKGWKVSQRTAAQGLWATPMLCPENKDEKISSPLIMWASTVIFIPIIRSEVRTQNKKYLWLQGSCGVSIKGHSGRSSGVFLQMCELKPDCLAVWNLPVQWLWLGLCTSAGMRWGCVAQRWLRHLRIVAPEKQLVTWLWMTDRWIIVVQLCLPGIPRMWWCNECKCYSDQLSPLLHLWMHPRPEAPGTHTETHT